MISVLRRSCFNHMVLSSKPQAMQIYSGTTFLNIENCPSMVVWDKVSLDLAFCVSHPVQFFLTFLSVTFTTGCIEYYKYCIISKYFSQYICINPDCVIIFLDECYQTYVLCWTFLYGMVHVYWKQFKRFHPQVLINSSDSSRHLRVL